MTKLVETNIANAFTVIAQAVGIASMDTRTKKLREAVAVIRGQCTVIDELLSVREDPVQ